MPYPPLMAPPQPKPMAHAEPPGNALLALLEGVSFQIGVSELTSDDDLLLVTVNRAAAAAIGMRVEDIQGRRISELGLAGPGRGVWLAEYHQALSTGAPVTFERPSGIPGNEAWWNISLTHIGRGPTGQPRFAYIVQDITERKQQERRQEALFRISEAVLSKGSLPELFASIHQIVAGLLPARNFFIALHDKATNELCFPYHVDEFDPPPSPMPLDDGTLSGRVITQGRSLLSTPQTAADGAEPVFGAPSLDWLGVPLKAKGETIGALVVQSYQGDVRYTAKDQELLEFVSNQVATAIERKRSNEAAAISEARLEQAQRIAHLGSWHWDISANTLTWSDELCRIYGLDPATHKPSFEDFAARIHPDDREHVLAEVARAVKEHQRFDHEVRLVRPDGEVRVISDQAEFELDANGNPIAMTGACLDVTETRRAATLEQDRSLILEQVVQNEPVETIMRRMVEALEHQRPGMRACLLLMRQGEWQVGAAPSFPPGFSRDVESLPLAELSTTFAAPAFSHGTVLTMDVAHEAAWAGVRELCARHGIVCCWSAPILAAQGGVLGTLCLVGPGPRDAYPEDQQLLESMGRLAAVALEHRTLTDELSYQAHHDALTGLPNRLLFQDRLTQALALAPRTGNQLVVFYMDLDRFKQVNDSLGHAAGDELLRQAARRLRGCIRSSDTLARLGGDEFTAVLTQLSVRASAMRVARQMLEAMRTPFLIGNRELFVTLSLGISVYPDDGADAGTLMVNADVAMYRAKELGRDNFQWFDAEFNEAAREKLELEGDLRHALEQGELRLEYQPQCDHTGKVVAFEALMRWKHPRLGEVSPGRFIPLAEESGLIVPIGEWALRTACHQAAAWRTAGHDVRVSVNVSAMQFRRGDWVDTVRHALRDAGLPPQALELEITESLLLQSAKESSANLFELRALDVGVAIDDFGTGYSSLSYLHKLPITTLKIDQSFVREIGLAPISGQEDAPIIRTIIALAHNLGMSVVAEGVETQQQQRVLVELGCEYLQGYFLHRPLPVDAATALLARS